MVRSRRSISKEDVSIVLTDSGISLSSPPHSRDLRSVSLIRSRNCLDGVKLNIRSGTTTKSLRQTETPHRKQHVCSHCTKEFGGKTDLKRHMLIHSNERPHKCISCGKCYRQAVNLKNHITTAHEHNKQFSCPECPKSFALKDRLRLHMRLHSGEKPYACVLCDKRFARGGQLQQHVISHHKTSIQQFNCTKCSASFSTNNNLRVHMDRHEQNVKSNCAKFESQSSKDLALCVHINQEDHKLSHMNSGICHKTIDADDKRHPATKTHICDICNSYFTQKSQYNVHMRMHTGERPYLCQICHQTFAHSSVLKLHIRKHTGEKPFCCLLCTDGVAFSQLAHLKNHMKKIHKQQPYMCLGCHQFFRVKVDLQSHVEQCHKYETERGRAAGTQNEKEILALSNMRFNVAVVLKNISSPQKLRQLGYEKRLIDNVIIASLKIAHRRSHEDETLTPLARLRLNVEEFLKWIVPPSTMQKFSEEQLSIDSILEKFATVHMK